jgi:exosome complex component RRP43
MLPLSTLVISSGQVVWCLYIDATCINYDGNAFDAALLAMVAALGNSECSSIHLFYSWKFGFRWDTSPLLPPLSLPSNFSLIIKPATLPQATFDPDTSGTTYSRAVRVPLSLNTSRMVVGLSFGWVGGR